jgi:integrase
LRGLVRRLARTAGIGAWKQLSPHSLRHSAITFALDAGASLRDVHDYGAHKDPRTTRRYDHSRDSLDRNAAYWGAPKLPDSPSIRMDVWKGEVIASTEEELLSGIQR